MTNFGAFLSGQKRMSPWRLQSKRRGHEQTPVPGVVQCFSKVNAENTYFPAQSGGMTQPYMSKNTGDLHKWGKMIQFGCSPSLQTLMARFMHRDPRGFGRTVYKCNHPLFEPRELYKQQHMANQIETQIPEKYVTVVAKMERSVMELDVLKSIISNGIA